MNRKVAMLIILATIVAVVAFETVNLFSVTGNLDRLIKSIRKFDTLYSQNADMNRQLAQYSRMIKSQSISVSSLRDRLLSLIPDASFKIDGNSITLEKSVQVDPKELLNLLGRFSNVDVVSFKLVSRTPVKYVGLEYSGFFREYVSLESLSIKVYGG